MLRFLSLAALFSLVVGQQGNQAAPIPPSPGYPACSVCGQEMEVSLQNIVLNLPGQPPVSCGDFQRAGALGFIEAPFCPALPTFAVPCACVPATASAAPITPAPQGQSTPQPTPDPTPNPTPLPTPAPVDAATPAPTDGPTSGTQQQQQRVPTMATSITALVAAAGIMMAV